MKNTGIIHKVSATLFVLLVLLVNTGCNRNGKESGITEISKAGVSFNCPETWLVEEIDLGDDVTYQIYCEADGDESVEMMFLLFANKEQNIDLWIVETVNLLKYDNMLSCTEFTEPFETKFLDVRSVSVDFEGKYEGNLFYGRITSFYKNGKSFVYYRQAADKKSLSKSFKTIENSLKIL